MIQFEHVISQSEVNSEYINLTDAEGKQYGPEIGAHGDVFRVVDGKGREFQMKRHHGNQLTRCSEWFAVNAIRPRTPVAIAFDRSNSFLRIVPVSEARSKQPAPLGSLSFTHSGRLYEVRCTLEGGRVHVRGFVDGVPKSTLEL